MGVNNVDVNVELLGVDELISKLDLTVQRVNRNVNRIIKESAKPVKKQLEKVVPTSNPMKHPDEGHARDDIIISDVMGRQNDKYADITFKQTSWRMKFLEYGTIKNGKQAIESRHYVEKASVEVRDKVLSIQRKELLKVIARRGG